MGEAIIEQLSKDLTAAFPGMKGFSKRNLFYIRQWYLFYTEGLRKVPQLVAQLQNRSEVSSNSELMPRHVAQIPWGHNREIISKCSDMEEAFIIITNNQKQLVESDAACINRNETIPKARPYIILKLHFHNQWPI